MGLGKTIQIIALIDWHNKWKNNLEKSYLIVATKMQYNIYSIDKIPYKTKIGILNKNNSMYFYIDIFLKDLNYNKNDLDIIIYDTIQDLYKGFKNNEVKVIIYTESLPSTTLNNFIDYDKNEKITSDFVYINCESWEEFKNYKRMVNDILIGE
jgi:hypothetical protein